MWANLDCLGYDFSVSCIAPNLPLGYIIFEIHTRQQNLTEVLRVGSLFVFIYRSLNRMSEMCVDKANMAKSDTIKCYFISVTFLSRIPI